MTKNIIQKFQNGDRESYQLIFNKFYSLMCLFAKKLINDYDDAEDIAQEVFIELWNHRVKFESFEQIKAFLYTSIKNRCFNFKKHLLVKEKYVNSGLVNEDNIFEESVLETEIVQNIKSAINNLPEQRKQIILHSMMGLKNQEIAEFMKISINTVKLQKKIAYKQLREKLKPSIFLFFFFL